MAKQILRDLNSRRYFPDFRDHLPVSGPINQMGHLGTINTPTFGYLFLKNRNYVDWKKDVPINFVWATMEKYALPVYTEYVETTDNPAFLEISEVFFKNLFWSGEIYVGCNYAEEQPNNEDLGYFSLWFKIDSEWFKGTSVAQETKDFNKITRDFKNRFINLLDGKEYILKDWETELIKVTWPLINNFSEWFNFAYQTIINNKLLQNLTYATGKIAVVEYDGPNIANSTNQNWIKENLAALNNPNCAIFYDNKARGGEITPANLASSEHLKGVALATYHIRDRELAELGRVANLNPKGDRLSTGENYKDLIGVANRQRAVLNMLKLFAYKVEKKGGPKLIFAMNGIPERAPADSDSETAPLPGAENNTEDANK